MDPIMRGLLIILRWPILRGLGWVIGRIGDLVAAVRNQQNRNV